MPGGNPFSRLANDGANLVRVTGSWKPIGSNNLDGYLRRLVFLFDNGQTLTAGDMTCESIGCSITESISIAPDTTITKLQGTIHQYPVDQSGVGSVTMEFSDGQRKTFGIPTGDTVDLETYSGQVRGFVGSSGWWINYISFFFVAAEATPTISTTLTATRTADIPEQIRQTLPMQIAFAGGSVVDSQVRNSGGSWRLLKVTGYWVPMGSDDYAGLLRQLDFEFDNGQILTIGSCQILGCSVNKTITVDRSATITELEGTIYQVPGSEMAGVGSLRMRFSDGQQETMGNPTQETFVFQTYSGVLQGVFGRAESHIVSLGFYFIDGALMCAAPVQSQGPSGSCNFAEMRPAVARCGPMAVLERLNALHPGLCKPPAEGCRVVQCNLAAAALEGTETQALAAITTIVEECAPGALSS